MEIIKDSGNLSPAEKFNFAHATSHKMSEKAGQTLPVEKWMLFKDLDKKTGEERKVLVIADTDGTSYATISPTFVGSFEDAVEFFDGSDDTLTSITVIESTSKNNRKFIDCVIN